MFAKPTEVNQGGNKMSRLSKIATQVQYLINYQSGVIEDEILEPILELLRYEEIEHRVVQASEDGYWLVDIGSYLLN